MGRKKSKQEEVKVDQLTVPDDLLSHSFFTAGVIINWIDKNIMCPMKDQGKQCESCVAQVIAVVVAAVFLLEHNKKYDVKKPFNLAVQMLIDCATKPKLGESKSSTVCRHSNFTEAYKYIKKNGICEEALYGGYKAKLMPCLDPKGNRVTIKGYTYAKVKCMEDILRMLRISPLSAAVVYTQEFKTHSGKGIYKAPAGTRSSFKEEDDWGDVNLHAVTILNYGKEPSGEEFFTLQNSWGPGHGYFGYSKVAVDCVHLISSAYGAELFSYRGVGKKGK